MAEWKEVSGGQGLFVRWEEKASSPEAEAKTIYLGNEVEGVYTKKMENVGANSSNVYSITTEKNGLVSVWGTTVLDDKMKEVPVGYEVKIVMSGKQKPKSGAGKAYYTFQVFSAKPAMVEVGVDKDEVVVPEM